MDKSTLYASLTLPRSQTVAYSFSYHSWTALNDASFVTSYMMMKPTASRKKAVVNE